MSWSDPDLRKQVEEASKYRLGNHIQKFKFLNTGESTNGKYRYVYAGKFVATEAPDLSLDEIVQNFMYFIKSADLYEMEKQLDYNSYKVSYYLYDTIHYNTLILLLNNLFANLYFNSNEINTYTAPRKQHVNNYMNVLATKTSGTSARQVTTPEQLQNIIKYLKDRHLERPDSISALTALKINTVPDEYFIDMTDLPIYKYLVSQIGEDKIDELLTQLDKYIRIK